MTKSIKRNVIVSSLLAICLCVSLIAGATFAIFTSESKVNIAVTSGTVKVEATVSELEAYSPKTISMDGTIADGEENIADNNGTTKKFGNGGTALYDEENNKLELNKLTPGDKVTFKIIVKNLSNVKAKYRTRVICDEDTGLFDELSIEIGETYTGRGVSQWADLALEQMDELACSVVLPGKATVQDTSCVISFVVEAVQGNAETKNDTAYYSLKEFNELTEIPEGIKNVYLSIGTVSLKDGGVIIGNDDLRDKYERNSTSDDPYGISYTDKEGINLIISGGTIKDGPDVDNSVSNKISFRIPNKSTVIFKNVKIEGFFGFTGAMSDNPYGTVMPHKIAGVIFDGCTFDALWLQNGSFGTSLITIKNSTFKKHENSVYASNTNPLWFKNIGQNGGTDIYIDNCVFNTNRPVKVVEQDVSGQTVSITDCIFNMESDADNKNAAIMFSTTSTGSTLGNVVISGNKVNGGVALLAFYNPAQITMAEEAVFTVSGNTLGDGVKTSVKWGSAEEFTPGFVG